MKTEQDIMARCADGTPGFAAPCGQQKSAYETMQNPVPSAEATEQARGAAEDDAAALADSLPGRAATPHTSEASGQTTQVAEGETDACAPPKAAQEAESTAAQPGTPVAPAPLYTPAPPAPPLEIDTLDRIMMLVYSVLGYAFIYVFTNSLQSWFYLSAFGWLLLGFTVLYAAAVLGYLRLRKLHPPVESWFWLGVMLCIAAPMPSHLSLGAVQVLGLMALAAYWTLCASGALLAQQGGITSGFLPLDALNALVIVPFGNFFAHLRVFFSVFRGLKRKKPGKRTLGILLGVVLAVPLLALVLPLLSSADAGFSALVQSLTQWWAWDLSVFFGRDIQEFLLRFLLSLPVTAFLYGLIYGCVRRRNTQHIHPAGVTRALDAAHALPNSSAYTVQLVLCGVYVVFILLQARYLFSAFTGVLPQGFTFAEYARSGFFELCRIAALNLCVLLGTNVLAKMPRSANRRLRGCNMVLSGLTLLLLATAASKMVLYIGAYGLTWRRILSSAMLLWLVLVFAAALVWQLRAFNLTRFCAMAAAVLVCALCLVNLEECANAYNRTHVVIAHSERAASALGTNAADAVSIGIVQSASDEVYGIAYEYYIDDTLIGGGEIQSADNSAIPPNEILTAQLTETDFPAHADLSRFAIEFFVIDAAGNRHLAANKISFVLQYGDRASVVMQGDRAQGYSAFAL